MYDRRNLTSGGVGSPVHIFEGHSAAVLCVQVLDLQFAAWVLFFCYYYFFKLAINTDIIYCSGPQLRQLSSAVLQRMAS